jgi:hypothetical protein
LPFSLLGASNPTYATKWRAYSRTPLLLAKSLPDS